MIRHLFTMLIGLWLTGCGINANNNSQTATLFFTLNNDVTKNKPLEHSARYKTDTSIPSELTSLIININDIDGLIINSFDLLEIKNNGTLKININAYQQYTIVSVAKSNGITLYSGSQNISALYPGESRKITLVMNPQLEVTLNLNSKSIDNLVSIEIGAINLKKFELNIKGLENNSVAWSVNDIAGGNEIIGFIDSSGTYTPPKTLPENINIQIKAVPDLAPSFTQIIDFILIPKENDPNYVIDSNRDDDDDGVLNTAELIFGSNPQDPNSTIIPLAMLGQTNSLGIQLSHAIYTSNGENDISAYALNSPAGTTTDADNNRIFISDRSNNRILIFDTDPTTGNINSPKAITVLGQVDAEHNEKNRAGAASANTLSSPRKGTYFNDGLKQWFAIADSSNHRVLIYDVSEGISNGMQASIVLGQTNFINQAANLGGATSGCLSTTINAASLNKPKSVHINTVGNQTLLFIADTYNNRVLIWNISEKGIEGLSNNQSANYVIGQPNFQTRSSNSCSSASSTTLDDPRDITVWNNFLIIADELNNRVLIYNLGLNAENLITSPQAIAATNILGQNNFTTESVNQNNVDASPNTLANPKSVDVFEGFLFVADDANNRVLAFDLNSITSVADPEAAPESTPEKLLKTSPRYIIGQDSFSKGYNQTLTVTQSIIDHPHDASVVKNSLYIAEKNGDRVSIFDISSLSEKIANQTFGPDAINLIGQTDWIPGKPDADTNLIYTAEGSNDTNAVGLESPAGISLGTIMGDNFLFVADALNFRVLVFQLDNEWTPLDLKADFVIGDKDFEHSDEASSSSKIGQAISVHFDNISQILYVADSSNNRVLGFDLSSGISSSLQADQVIGQENFTDSRANKNSNLSASSLNTPKGITTGTINGTHYLFISDNANKRILLYDTTKILTVNSSADLVLGQPDFITLKAFDDNSLIDPRGLKFDLKSNQLFVADGSGSRILIWNFSAFTSASEASIGAMSNGMPASKIFGQNNFFDTASGVTARNFDIVTDVAIDNTKNILWAADETNNRVLGFNLSEGIKNGDSAFTVLGQMNFLSNLHYHGDKRTSLTLDAPAGLAITPNDEGMIISQKNDNRILFLKLKNTSLEINEIP